MKKLIRSVVIVGVLALGFTSISAPAANAVTSWYYWTTGCIGKDLWSIKVTTYTYSILEKSLWPYPKDYTTRKAVTLKIHNYYKCSGTSYA
jgi:hypothetical protein